MTKISTLFDKSRIMLSDLRTVLQSTFETTNNQKEGNPMNFLRLYFDWKHLSPAGKRKRTLGLWNVICSQGFQQHLATLREVERVQGVQAQAAVKSAEKQKLQQHIAALRETKCTQDAQAQEIQSATKPARKVVSSSRVLRKRIRENPAQRHLRCEKERKQRLWQKRDAAIVQREEANAQFLMKLEAAHHKSLERTDLRQALAAAASGLCDVDDVDVATITSKLGSKEVRRILHRDPLLVDRLVNDPLNRATDSIDVS